MLAGAINDIRSVGRALMNLLRAAAQRPVMAFFMVVLSPLLMIPRLFRMGVGLLVVGLVLLVILYLIPADWPWVRAVLSWALGIAFLWLAFRLLTWPLIDHFGDVDDSTHGTARFASDAEVAALTRGGSVVSDNGAVNYNSRSNKDERSDSGNRIGQTGAGNGESVSLRSTVPDGGLLIGRHGKTGKLLRYDGPAHLLTMAPTRSGKGVGTIIPNLLVLNRSVICVDPKGENAKITGAARARFGPVYVLDPFGVSGVQTAAFNPLEQMTGDSLDVAEDAATLAEALVHDEPGMAGEAHWNEEAKALITGLILHVVSCETSDRKNLSTVREYLTLAPQAFFELLSFMQTSRHCYGLIARAANRHLSKADREAAGVLSAAQRHTHFLDSPRMHDVLKRSDFSFADLKLRPMSVFLVLPPDRLGTYARWLRLMVTQSLTDLARTEIKPTRPILYLLDEFAALGYLAPIERAMGLMAGYGVQLWPILQDIHQLKATYGQKAGTFLSNAGVLQVFGVNDHDSSKLVSDLLGQGTVVFRTQGTNLDSEKSGLSYGEQHTGRPLLTPDEVRNLPQHVQLLFLTGMRPIVATKIRYYADREFAGPRP